MEASTLTFLAKGILDWLTRLAKTSGEEKKKCLTAVEEVVGAVRRTEAYCRARDAGHTDIRTEGDLAEMWTRIGYSLRSVGATALAKRCDVKGRYWANPEKFSDEWWDAADIGLDSVEKLAHQIRLQVERTGSPK